MDNIIGLHKKSSTAKISRFVLVSYLIQILPQQWWV